MLLSSVVALVLVFPVLEQEAVVQQSGVPKHLEILMDDWARLWGENLGEPEMYYCDREGPTSLPVVCGTDMEYEGR